MSSELAPGATYDIVTKFWNYDVAKVHGLGSGARLFVCLQDKVCAGGGCHVWYRDTFLVLRRHGSLMAQGSGFRVLDNGFMCA